MMTASSKSQLKDSTMNLLLMHCSFCLTDARIRVEYSVSDDNFSWLCYSRELKAHSSHKELGCLLGGFIGLVFVPLREADFNLEASKLEIGVEKKDHSSCILTCVNPSFGITLKDLSLLSSSINVSEMDLSFSPSQVEMMGAFNNLLNIECRHFRSGRLLWGIARRKIRNSFLPAGCMFYSIVLLAIYWLRLVKEYHCFLILVGYSEHGLKMPNDGKFPKLAEQQRKTISQILEKELPAEAIASARRVARHRAALIEPYAEDISVPHIDSDPTNFWWIVLPLVCIWKATIKLFHIVVTVFRLHKMSLKIGQLIKTTEVIDPSCCIYLSLGKISAAISSIDASFPLVRTNSNLRRRTTHTDAFSLFLMVKGFLYISEEGISEQYTYFSIGCLEVTSAHNFLDFENKARPETLGGALRRHLKERLDGPETIVSGEPALMCFRSREGETGHEKVPILDQMPGEIELIWRRMQQKFQGGKGSYDGSPWVLCIIQKFLVYPSLKSPDVGFSNCSFMAGRLNIASGYSTILSIAKLREYLQHAFCRYGSQSVVVPLHSSKTFQESQEINSLMGIHSSSFRESAEDHECSSLNFAMKTMKMSILKLLPEKNVKMRALIAGPHFKISVRNEELPSNKLELSGIYGENGINLLIDVNSIEFAIWPTAKFVVVPCKEDQRPDNSESEFFKLEEFLVEGYTDALKNKYASKRQVRHFYYIQLCGLKLYFEDLVDNHLMQMLLLKPMTVNLSSSRFGISSALSIFSMHWNVHMFLVSTPSMSLLYG